MKQVYKKKPEYLDVVFVADAAMILVEPIEWIRELGHEPLLCQPVVAPLEHFNRRGPPVC